VVALLVFAFVLPAPMPGFDHSGWDKVLKAYVNEIGSGQSSALLDPANGDLRHRITPVGRRRLETCSSMNAAVNVDVP